MSSSAYITMAAHRAKLARRDRMIQRGWLIAFGFVNGVGLTFIAMWIHARG